MRDARGLDGGGWRSAGAEPDRGGELIERDVDVGRVCAAIERALSGEGALVFVHGPAGIGKTRLVGVCAHHASASGMDVLSARCTELERDFTHNVVRQLFERTLLGAAPEQRARLLAGPASHAAAAVIGERPASRHGTPGDSDFAALHGLYWLAANLAAEGPCLLLIDDAHWADAASLRFVGYLANRLAGLPLVVLVAARSDEPRADADLLQMLAASAAVDLQLSPLSARGSAQVVRRHLDATDAFAAACHDSTGGNPFLLHELLNAIAIDGIAGDDPGAARVRQLTPKSVARAVALRLARLLPGALEFAQAVAVLGDQVELADAAALAGIPVAEAAALCDALVVAGVLAPEAPLCFIHPVILEAVASGLGPGERAAAHARAAELLHARGASADQIAAHLAAAGPSRQPWATEVLRRAARAATVRGAPDVALHHLRRALREDHTAPTRGAVLAELGEAQWLCGEDPAAAIEHLREACRLTTDPSIRARATIIVARAHFSGGDVARAAEVLRDVLDAPGVLEPRDRVRLEAELGTMGILNPALLPRARERLEAFGELAGDSTEELLMLCSLAVLRLQFGTAAETAALARRALAGGRLLAAVGSDNIAFLQAVTALRGADCLEEARAACEDGLVDARTRGSVFGFAGCCVVAAMAAIRAGDVRECEAHARASIDLPLLARPAIYARLAHALIERGELDGAEWALEQGLVGPRLPVMTHMNGGFHTRALLRIAQGRDEEALADMREFGAREALCLVDNAVTPWRVDAARTCLRLGRADEATALLDEHEPIAARWGTPAAIGVTLQGRAAAADGPQRIELLDRARELLERSPCRLDHARVLLDLGSALRRAGRRRDAQRRISEAVALARRCGATALATQANDELGVLSARPRRLQFSGVESLTASEHRIARMAAAGLSNPQIAQALFVTAKTVENHLGRVYIKLAIKSRAELAAALRESVGDEPAARPPPAT